MRDRILREVPEKRERCVKHFQMTQKGMAAAVYPAPVHYEEDGQWKEIDNRLEAVQENGREVYRNLASAVRVSFAKESDTKELVTIEKDGKKILWGLATIIYLGVKYVKKNMMMFILWRRKQCNILMMEIYISILPSPIINCVKAKISLLNILRKVKQE